MTMFLIVFIIFTVWIASLIVHPFGKCWACQGKGVHVKQGRGTARARKCWLCKGHKRRQRFGSRRVHRIRRAAAAGWQARKETLR